MSACPLGRAAMFIVLAHGLAGAADAPAPVSPPIDPQAVSATFGFRGVTDYNSRGISQTNHNPGVQGYLELQMLDGLAYAGIAGASLTLPNRPFMEMDFSGGIRPTFGAWSFDFGYLFYNYPNERALIGPDRTIYTANNADYYEFAAKVTYTATDSLTLGANVYTSPSYFGTHAPGTYVSGIMKYTVSEGTFGIMPSGFLVSSEFGHYFLGTTNASFGRFRLPDYNYGNIGVAYTYKNITLDVRFHDTTLTKTQCGTLTAQPRGIFTGSFQSNWCGAAVVATLSFDVSSKDPGIFAADTSTQPSVPARTSDAEGPAQR